MIENKEQLQSRMGASALEDALESAIMEHAIDRFPYSDALQHFYDVEDSESRQLLEEYIGEGVVKIGFYYEEMQENLVIFYFLRAGNAHYTILGLNPTQTQINIDPKVNSIFRLHDQQYIDLLQIPMN